MKLRTIPLVCVLGAVELAGADVLYVNHNAMGAGNGATWADAFDSIQVALLFAQPGDELWIAEGTYKPTTIGNRAASFRLTDGVNLYGGFDGTEVAREDRDWLAHPTILSGDLLGDDVDNLNLDENSINVVSAYSLKAGSTVDGFTITGGYAEQMTDFDIPPSDSNLARGGGVYSFESNLTLRNMEFRSNTARLGGAMYLVGEGYVRIENSQFVENRALSLDLPGGSGGGLGGAIFQSGGGGLASTPTLTIISCEFNGNFASEEGGAVWQAGQTPESSIESCRFEGNQASGDGGALYINDQQAAPSMDCEFVNNTARRGGAIASTHRIMSHGSSFEGNASDQDGGAIWGPSTLTACAFLQNSAGLRGGAVYSVSNSQPAFLSLCSFEQNQAGSDGGALALVFSPSGIVEFCTFEGNTADRGGAVSAFNSLSLILRDSDLISNSATYGGAVLAEHASATVQRCNFVTNQNPGDGQDEHGPALFMDASTVYLFDCILSSNEGTQHGALRVTDGSVIDIRRTAISDNSTTSPGGVGGGGGLSITDSQASIRFSSFMRNRSIRGGALHIEDSSVDIVVSEFWNNVSESSGGAVDLEGSEPLRVEGSIFLKNYAETVGGAVVTDLESASVYCNSLFVENSANASGVLAVPQTAVAEMVNCTVLNNSANTGPEAAGVAGELKLRNCIVSQPGLPGLGGSGVIDASYCLIRGGFSGVQIIDVDPQLESSWSPCPGSPVIDAGSNANVCADEFDRDMDIDVAEPTPFDFYSQPRFRDDLGVDDTGQGAAPIVDIGAIEHQEFSACGPADLDENGLLNFDDVLILLQLFVAGDLQIDFDGNEILNFTDISEFLQFFIAGC